MKLKNLAAVLALAAVAPAFASIQSPSTGDGELFAVVYDAVDQASYTLDLGILMSGFNGGGSYNYALSGANWDGFVGAAGTDNLRFAVMGADATGSTAANPKQLFTTVNSGTLDATQFTNQMLTSTTLGVTNYGVYQVTASAHNSAQVGPATINGDSWDSVGNNAYFLTSFTGLTMSTFIGQAKTWNNNNAAGTSAVFRSFALSSTAGGGQTVQNDFAGVWNLTQDNGGTWNLSYSVAAVPEPGTLALMLAGFGAVGFVARRRARG